MTKRACYNILRTRIQVLVHRHQVRRLAWYTRKRCASQRFFLPPFIHRHNTLKKIKEIKRVLTLYPKLLSTFMFWVFRVSLAESACVSQMPFTCTARLSVELQLCETPFSEVYAVQRTQNMLRHLLFIISFCLPLNTSLFSKFHFYHHSEGCGPCLIFNSWLEKI